MATNLCINETNSRSHAVVICEILDTGITIEKILNNTCVVCLDMLPVIMLAPSTPTVGTILRGDSEDKAEKFKTEEPPRHYTWVSHEFYYKALMKDLKAKEEEEMTSE